MYLEPEASGVTCCLCWSLLLLLQLNRRQACRKRFYLSRSPARTRNQSQQQQASPTACHATRVYHATCVICIHSSRAGLLTSMFTDYNVLLLTSNGTANTHSSSTTTSSWTWFEARNGLAWLSLYRRDARCLERGGPSRPTARTTEPFACI
ncbi:unnamed protein product [Ectocarpus sp. 8 AP-2014]